MAGQITHAEVAAKHNRVGLMFKSLDKDLFDLLQTCAGDDLWISQSASVIVDVF